jgi:hypothetical protein
MHVTRKINSQRPCPLCYERKRAQKKREREREKKKRKGEKELTNTSCDSKRT